MGEVFLRFDFNKNVTDFIIDQKKLGRGYGEIEYEPTIVFDSDDFTATDRISKTFILETDLEFEIASKKEASL